MSPGVNEGPRSSPRRREPQVASLIQYGKEFQNKSQCKTPAEFSSQQTKQKVEHTPKMEYGHLEGV
jgi:hypothetical protein